MKILKVTGMSVFFIAVAIGVSACDKDEPADPINPPYEVGSKVNSDQVDDIVITSKVNEAIFAEYDKNVFDVTVVTLQGVTTLKGMVESMERLEKIALLVASIDGVKSVKNELLVKAIK